MLEGQGVVTSTEPHPGILALGSPPALNWDWFWVLPYQKNVEVTWCHFWHEGGLVASSACVEEVSAHITSPPHSGKPTQPRENPCQAPGHLESGSCHPVEPPLLMHRGLISQSLDLSSGRHNAAATCQPQRKLAEPSSGSSLKLLKLS